MLIGNDPGGSGSTVEVPRVAANYAGTTATAADSGAASPACANRVAASSNVFCVSLGLDESVGSSSTIRCDIASQNSSPDAEFDSALPSSWGSLPP